MNPFVIAGRIPDKYFCDRQSETSELKKLLLNGHNVTLISPRRMGKSGLILHCFDIPEISENFATLYIDILQSSSLKEFVFLFGKAVYDKLVPKTTKWITKFFQTLKSLNGKFTMDSMTGLPSFNFILGEIAAPELTLDEIFQYIEVYGKRCIIAFDEFQQITKYSEKNVEASLRARIQLSQNANFIFSGSERHIMQEMFFTYNRPFYNSTTIMSLPAIPKEIYIEFAERNFEEFGKKLKREAISDLYDRFEGYTYYLQRVMNEAFLRTELHKECSFDTIKESTRYILESNSTVYREILSNIPGRQKDLLYAMAINGPVAGLTSSAFVKKYNLLSAAAVQSASKILLEKDFITKSEGVYSLTDKFLELWIKHIYG